MNLFSLIPAPYALLVRWAALALVIVAAGGYGYVKGLDHNAAKHEAERVALQKQFDESVRKAGQTTADLKATATAIQGAHDDEIAAINTRLADALADGVRLRKERRANSTQLASTCGGASGMELARPDAGFLTRYAASAARLQSSYDQCQTLYNAARDALSKLATP